MEYTTKVHTDYKLADLIDIHLLRNFTDNFFQLTEISSAILDSHGTILAASGWREICTKFHRKNPDTNKNCIESDIQLLADTPENLDYNIYKCKNGLIDIRIPIVIEKIHYGNIYIGQFLLEEPDIDFFIEKATKYGFELEEYLRCLNEVPVFAEDKIENAIRFLQNLSQIIIKQGVDRKKLLDYNKELNNVIREKTDDLVYNNNLLRLLSNTSFEGIVLSEDGIVIEANNVLAHMLEFKHQSEIIGNILINFVAEECRDDVLEKIQSNYEDLYQTVGYTRSGKKFPMEIKGKTFEYQGRKIRGTIVHDITEKIEAEEEIRKLRKILPICSFCKKIRNEQGNWEPVDAYIHNRAIADISHSVCPECGEKHHGSVIKQLKEQKRKSSE